VIYLFIDLFIYLFVIAHVNFAGVHNEVGPIFVSVLTHQKDPKENGYRALIRTQRVTFSTSDKSHHRITETQNCSIVLKINKRSVEPNFCFVCF
jgi:hypothetical protein